MFDTRLNSFGQKPVCVSVGAVPSPLKVFATNKTDVHIDPIRSSVMKRMSFAYARMNHSLRAAYLITLTFGECKNYLERETLQSFSKSKSRTLLKGVFFNQGVLNITIQGILSANIYQHVQYLIKIYLAKIQI